MKITVFNKKGGVGKTPILSSKWHKLRISLNPKKIMSKLSSSYCVHSRKSEFTSHHEFLGHSNVSVTAEYYSRVSLEDKSRVVG